MPFTSAMPTRQVELFLLCKRELGRSPAPKELGAWRELVDAGISVAQLRQRIASTAEARLNALCLAQAGEELPPDLRCDCLEQLNNGEALEAVAYYLLGRLDERNLRAEAA